MPELDRKAFAVSRDRGSARSRALPENQQNLLLNLNEIGGVAAR